MSETFDDKQYEIYIHDDFAEVVWHTKMQVMAEDLTDSLEKKLGAHILFASSQENGRIIKVEAYSTPVENSMYAIYLSSDQHGVIDSITVFFFDSLDIMYHHLRKDYQSITKVEGDIIEKQSFARFNRYLYLTFIKYGYVYIGIEAYIGTCPDHDSFWVPLLDKAQK